MSADMFRFNSFIDNMKIESYVWRVDSPVAVVVIAHGAAEHAPRYARFAEKLMQRKIEVWANDHRGHGRTAGLEKLADFGTGGWDALVDDMDQLITIAHNHNPDAAVFLLGHSMGSAAAQQYALDHSHEIDGLILSGSTAWEQIIGKGKVDLGRSGFEERTPFDWLSRDQAEVDAYISDPFCGFSFGDGLGAGEDGRQRIADPSSFKSVRPDLPLLLVAGDQDPINNQLAGLRKLERFYRDAGIVSLDTLYYPGGRHEMLNEINRDDVTQDIVNWLEQRL